MPCSNDSTTDVSALATGCPSTSNESAQTPAHSSLAEVSGPHLLERRPNGHLFFMDSSRTLGVRINPPLESILLTPFEAITDLESYDAQPAETMSCDSLLRDPHRPASLHYRTCTVRSSPSAISTVRTTSQRAMSSRSLRRRSSARPIGSPSNRWLPSASASKR